MPTGGSFDSAGYGGGPKRRRAAGVRRNTRGDYPGPSPGGMPNEPVPGANRRRNTFGPVRKRKRRR